MYSLTWLLLYSVLNIALCQKYQPTWESLDSRPLPSWYDQAKVGIFIHWGVFSVPSFGSEWFWESWKTSDRNSSYWKFMQQNYKPGFAYADFASDFTAEFYNPDSWADLFQASGAKYVVLTSKHHEGFCNWATNVSFSWNSMDVGPHRDLLGDLAKSIRNRTNLVFGVYHSLFEWFNPLYLTDKQNGWKTQLFSLGKTIPELKELVNAYKPELIWSDGEWEAPDYYWSSREFLAWLYNDSPVKDTVVVNDRWCDDCMCHHGGYYTCQDRFNPGVLQKRKWENAMTLDEGSWGYRRNVDLSSFLSNKELVQTLAETVSCGGNLLVNVGPTKDGIIIPIFQERLLQLGAWLKVNGEAVYGSSPWFYQNDTVTSGIWYTHKNSSTSATGYSVYAFIFEWPDGNELILGAPVASPITQITMLGYGIPFKYTQPTNKSNMTITFPFISPRDIPSFDGWVLRFDGLRNS